ncbi:MAG: beta-phosphoglucomutase [Bacillota bacterium]
MNIIKACIFDLDGVIVDTAKYHYLAWKAIADELGFDFTEEHNERLKGISRMASLDILLEIGGVSMSADDKNLLAEKKNNIYVDYINKMPKEEILPGVKDFLKELRSKGIRIALGSASKNAISILNRLELLCMFDAIVDGNKVVNAKPDPEVFLRAASELLMIPVQCMVFEDAAAGVKAAKAAGMSCVGIGDPKILYEADMVIPGFEHIDIDTVLNAKKELYSVL